MELPSTCLICLCTAVPPNPYGSAVPTAQRADRQECCEPVGNRKPFANHNAPFPTFTWADDAFRWCHGVNVCHCSGPRPLPLSQVLEASADVDSGTQPQRERHGARRNTSKAPSALAVCIQCAAGRREVANISRGCDKRVCENLHQDRGQTV